MSGYSKSNNALNAESGGKFPASVLARRLGCKIGAIKALLLPCERHHTSKYYNLTNYYSEDDALEIIESLRAWAPLAKDVMVFDGCSGSYLKWSGTRNYPHATEISFGPVRATKKGKWFTLELPSPMRKSAVTRGFHLFDSDKRPLTFNR